MPGPAKDKTLKISLAVDDELSRLSDELRIAKGTIAEAILEQGMASLDTVRQALNQRIEAGLANAQARRDATTPIRTARTKG